MDIHRIHLIKGEKDKNILFHYPTFSIIRINDNLYNILTKIKEGESYELISQCYNINLETICRIISQLDMILINKHIEDNNTSDNAKSIGRITLHISNDCNLRCKYCYAHGGHYNLTKELMTYEVADEFISFCVKNFTFIKGIVFFGGEPLLNVKIIDYICSKFYELKRDGIIDYLPEFGIITNGTIMTDYIFSVIKQYISFITVSIDGTKEVNDSNRKFADNKGSYDKISVFIKKIKEGTDINIKYEATYTQQHINLNISESDVRLFLKKEFDLNGSLANDIINPPQWADGKESSYIFYTQYDYYEGFYSILFSIAKKKSKEMCLVGNKIIAVSTVGDIYPCHMNNGLEHLRLGNIAGDNIFTNPDKYKKQFPYLVSILKLDEPCISCWAQTICGGCTIKWFFDDNMKEYRSAPNTVMCDSNKRHLEKILLEIAEIKNDAKKWADLQENVKNVYDY
jgi:uncharacterized protein